MHIQRLWSESYDISHVRSSHKSLLSTIVKKKSIINIYDSKETHPKYLSTIVAYILKTILYNYDISGL